MRSDDLLADGPIRLPQHVDVVSHLVQHAQVSLCFGDESGVKGANCRGVALGSNEFSVSGIGRHENSRCVPDASGTPGLPLPTTSSTFEPQPVPTTHTLID